MTQSFNITYFNSAGARYKTEAAISLNDLAEKIRSTQAESKDQLPWLKMANFGAITTPKGSLRQRFMDLGQWWLKHPARRQYFGLVFEPGGEPVVDGKPNLWTGWVSSRSAAIGA